MRSVLPFFAVTLVLSAIPLAACKKDESKPAAAGDTNDLPHASGGGSNTTPTGDAAVLDSGSDGGICNDIVNEGTLVDQNSLNGDPPAGTGGTIADGDYTITEATHWVGVSGVPGPTGISYNGTIRIAGQTFARVVDVQSTNGAPTEDRSSGTFATSGANLTVAITCLAPTTEQTSYSFTGTTLVVNDLVTRDSFTYTKK